jgi:hypothetical protein
LVCIRRMRGPSVAGSGQIERVAVSKSGCHVANWVAGSALASWASSVVSAVHPSVGGTGWADALRFFECRC